MFQALVNMFRVPDLRRKILFTLFILIIYRVGFWVPLPGVSQQNLKEYMSTSSSQVSGAGENDLVRETVGKIGGYIGIFTGGSLGQSTLFGLGIMPYITAAIIFQLFGTVSDKLKQMQKDPAGREKFQQWIRYTTVPLCVVQAFFWMQFLQSQPNLVQPEFTSGVGAVAFWVGGVTGLTAGTMFLLWLGEQIDKYGIGNGASLIITAGILASMPNAIMLLVEQFGEGQSSGAISGSMMVVVLAVIFVLVTLGCVMITQGQRRIPVQQAKHTRGRRVYGGQKSFLPLRVNHGGVMPIIFASSLMMLPMMVFPWLTHMTDSVPVIGPAFNWFRVETEMGKPLYEFIYVGMVYFFAYFWTSVQFQPKEVSQQLREHGSFVKGLRPGPRTAEYLETVMERITYCGAGFLALIAVIPSLVSAQLGIPFTVSAFLGGVGLLITVAVVLDLVQRIESELMMRNYPGFLSNSRGGKGPRIRGARNT